MKQTLRESLDNSIRVHASKLSLVDARSGSTLTYEELGTRLARVRARLARCGVAPGDVVAVVGGNSVELAIALLGVMSFGAIANPLNPSLAEGEVRVLLEHSAAKLVLAESADIWPSIGDMGVLRMSLLEALAGSGEDAQLEVPGPEDGALLIYTSGTTGKPKGVLLRHRNIVSNVAIATERLGLGADHRTLVILPLFHTFALISDLCSMLFCGGCAVIAPIFDVARLKSLEESVHRYDINSFSAVPLMFDLMLRWGVDLRSKQLRFCVSGAAPLRHATVQEFSERYGAPIIPAYGMTETTCFAAISPPNGIVPGSCGVPAGCEVRLVDQEGQEVPLGEIGELLVRGPSVITGGYFRDLRPAYSDDSGQWLCTGDLARRDSSGYLFIVGRKKNMVIRGGEKVYLEDLDQALAGLVGVRDCASVGVSKEHLERIVTFVVREPSRELERSDVMAHLRTAVGDSKAPDIVSFVAEIPRTATNKVRLAELQDLARSSV